VDGEASPRIQQDTYIIYIYKRRNLHAHTRGTPLSPSPSPMGASLPSFPSPSPFSHTLTPPSRRLVSHVAVPLPSWARRREGRRTIPCVWDCAPVYQCTSVQCTQCTVYTVYKCTSVHSVQVYTVYKCTHVCTDSGSLYE
jgi:hypothetical protein